MKVDYESTYRIVHGPSDLLVMIWITLPYHPQVSCRATANVAGDNVLLAMFYTENQTFGLCIPGIEQE